MKVTQCKDVGDETEDCQWNGDTVLSRRVLSIRIMQVARQPADRTRTYSFCQQGTNPLVLQASKHS